MDKILGREVDMDEVGERIEANFRDVFGYEMPNAVQIAEREAGVSAVR
jgi:hypothetical protein